MGFSAIDFVVRPKIGIDSFFRKGKTLSSSTKHLVCGNNDDKKEVHAKSGGIDSFFSTRKPHTTIPKSTKLTSPQPFNHGHGALHHKIPPPTSNEKRTSSTWFLRHVSKGTRLHNSLADDTAVAKNNSSCALTDEEIARQLQDSYDDAAKEQDKQDRDKALACQLQSSYDRENTVLSHAERFCVKRNNKSSTKSQRKRSSNKRSKIDYFLKKWWQLTYMIHNATQ